MTEILEKRTDLKINIDKCPYGTSPSEWSMTQAGWTQAGLQVWCNRCEKSVIELDFMGQKVSAK